MAGSRPERPGELTLYLAPDGEVRIHVRLEGETVWLSLDQMATLFGRHKSVISRHLRSVFSTGELERAAVVAKHATTASDGKTYQVEFYNLDAILSVGYRVNSKRGTHFRQWATGRLREHLLRGFTLREERLRERGVGDLEQAMTLLARTLERNALVNDEGRAVLRVVEDYARTWQLLQAYDEDTLAEQPRQPRRPTSVLTLAEARATVEHLRAALAEQGGSTALFGQERGEQLAAIVGSIEQTFGGTRLYPSVQARAAHLLYFAIKDHPFSDGNKRIGTLLFLEYLRRNGALLRPDGGLRLADDTMVALALLVAESEAGQKELMIRLILGLLDGP